MQLAMILSQERFERQPQKQAKAMPSLPVRHGNELSRTHADGQGNTRRGQRKPSIKFMAAGNKADDAVWQEVLLAVNVGQGFDCNALVALAS